MDDSPVFTKEQAWEIYGKRVLAGLTYLDMTGVITGQKQIHGTVIRANPKEGIVLQLEDGSEYVLPPDFRSFQKAKSGEYTLRSNGDVVIDPDYLCTFTVTVSRPQ